MVTAVRVIIDITEGSAPRVEVIVTAFAKKFVADGPDIGHALLEVSKKLPEGTSVSTLLSFILGEAET